MSKQSNLAGGNSIEFCSDRFDKETSLWVKKKASFLWGVHIKWNTREGRNLPGEFKLCSTQMNLLLTSSQNCGRVIESRHISSFTCIFKDRCVRVYVCVQFSISSDFELERDPNPRTPLQFVTVLWECGHKRVTRHFRENQLFTKNSVSCRSSLL